jgi:hypothetical protein
MDSSASPKFCAICKLPNEADALVCEHCGAVLVDLKLGEETTKSLPNKRLTDTLGGREFAPHAPLAGMAFFLINRTEPFFVSRENEVHLGRLEGEDDDKLVDLGLVDGFNMGVSRRHAMIRRGTPRCTITDLRSTNGTFLNGQRLQPAKPHEFESGTIIQLGRLQIIVVY